MVEVLIDAEVTMGTYLTAISALTRICDTDERELIEKMVFNAADYVQLCLLPIKIVKRDGADGDEFVTKDTLGAAIKDFAAKRFK